jgi:hypothetical protein
MRTKLSTVVALAAGFGLLLVLLRAADDGERAPEGLPKAFIDGTGHGWVAAGKDDFEHVNGAADTWKWRDDGVIECTGRPVGVIKSKKRYRNLELVIEWRHLRSGGNSGIFFWATAESLAALKDKPGLPHGIEVQVLDLGYAEQYEKSSGKKADWFTSHGDVFPVGPVKMTPFPPVSPRGDRSFPRKRLSRGVNEWNHYYVRAIDGEVRLWVNGEEVSGGTGCLPDAGFLCLESEGSPIEFRNLRIRELPGAPQD